MESGHITHKPILKEEFKCQKIDDNQHFCVGAII